MTMLRALIVLAPLTAMAAPADDPVTAAVPQNKSGNVVLTSHAKSAIEEVCYEAFFTDGGKDQLMWDCKDVTMAVGETEELNVPLTCGHATPPLTKLVVTSVGYAGGKRWVRATTAKAGAAPVTVAATQLMSGADHGKGCKLSHVVLVQNTGKKAVKSVSGESKLDGKLMTMTLDLAHEISPGEERPLAVDGTEFRLTSLSFHDDTSWDAH